MVCTFHVRQRYSRTTTPTDAALRKESSDHVFESALAGQTPYNAPKCVLISLLCGGMTAAIMLFMWAAFVLDHLTKRQAARKKVVADNDLSDQKDVALEVGGAHHADHTQLVDQG